MTDLLHRIVLLVPDIAVGQIMRTAVVLGAQIEHVQTLDPPRVARQPKSLILRRSSASRLTVEHLRKEGPTYRPELIQALEQAGYKRSNIFATLVKLTKRGAIYMNEDHRYVLSQEIKDAA